MEELSPDKRILALVKYIDDKFPAGCGIGIDCHTCPLNAAGYGTTEQAVCDLLEAMHWCS